MSIPTLHPHEALPRHLVKLITAQAWGRVGQALLDGLLANLTYGQGQTLLGYVMDEMASCAPAGSCSAPQGPEWLIESFINHGLADVADSEGATPVLRALRAGQWGWAQVLLAAGYACEPPEGLSAFHAILEGRLNRRLKGVVSPGETIGDDNIALLSSRLNQDAPEEAERLQKVIQHLCESGAGIDAARGYEADEADLRPVQVAVLYADVPVLSTLLLSGAWLDAKVDPGHDLDPTHPLIMAARVGGCEALELVSRAMERRSFLLVGADAMHMAAAQGHLDCLRFLYAQGVCFGTPSPADRFIPLHQACLHGRQETIDFLLAQGQNLHAESQTGVSPGDLLCLHHPELARQYGLVRPANVSPFPIRTSAP